MPKTVLLDEWQVTFRIPAVLCDADVPFVADPQLTTLLDFRFLQHHRARSGGHGQFFR